MKVNQFQVCRKCGYDANTYTATHCRLCNHTLNSINISDVSTKSSSTIPWSALPLLGLLFLVGGLYIFSRNYIVSPRTALNSDSTRTTASRQSPSIAAQVSSISDIQVYNSMQDVPNVPQGLFNYGGATCFAAMAAHGMNEAIIQAHPQFNLRYTEPPLNVPPGCSTGIGMLLNSELSFAQNGRSLTDSEYKKAKERGFAIQQVPVAIDGIVFFTHPHVLVPGLSLDQLQDIFLGKVTNWEQVGGPNLPIVAISQDPKVHVTLNLLLGNRINNMGRNVRLVRDYSTAIRQVASTPGSISYSSGSIAVGQQTVRLLKLARARSREYVSPFIMLDQVNVPAFRDGTYPLTRRLFVVIRRDGTPDEQSGVAYANMLLSAEGQRIIEEAGFAPIH